jgi:hypothetical protein
MRKYYNPAYDKNCVSINIIHFELIISNNMKRIITLCASFFLSIIFSFSQSVTIAGPTTACPGDNVTFTTTVTDVIPLTYQWKKNGNIIQFATDSGYIINYATFNDQAQYSVTISYDSAGTGTIKDTTSVNHSLAVFLPHTIEVTSGPKNQMICPGSSMTATVYTFGGGAESASATSLPLGLSQNIIGKTITISGTTTENGTYTITTSGNGCQPAVISGSITMIPQPSLEISSGQQNQTLCHGNNLATTVYTFDGCATGVTVNSLPAGLTQAVVGNTVTLSGIPTAGATYTITTISPCPEVSLSGVIDVISPLNLSQIDGDNSVCANQLESSYKIDSVIKAIYSWSVIGGEITYGNGTNKIVVRWGSVAMTGSVTVNVTDSNSCVSSQSLIVHISQMSATVLNDIVAKINVNGRAYLLIYPNPVEESFYQWYKNDDIISGANEQFYYPPSITPGSTLEPGADYKVFVASLNNFDCGNFTKPYRVLPLEKSGLIISPNPNDGNFVVSFGSTVTDLRGSVIEIYSLDGKIMQTGSVNTQEELNFNLTLANGFYYVKLNTVDNNSYIEKLLVK